MIREASTPSHVATYTASQPSGPRKSAPVATAPLPMTRMATTPRCRTMTTCASQKQTHAPDEGRFTWTRSPVIEVAVHRLMQRNLLGDPEEVGQQRAGKRLGAAHHRTKVLFLPPGRVLRIGDRHLNL